MSCLQSGLGVMQVRSNVYALKTDLEAEGKELYSEKESTCLDNCVYKVFATDKAMRAYLPTRLMELKLSTSELEKRLNNPNEEHGPYFLRREYEDSNTGS
mmetsp:Transcript_24063/g.29903  ORF Transcript_24063/g.29903 Transcript_24063/m.29903 type:complete len:100 (-) Transcript_24063:62-361(-)